MFREVLRLRPSPKEALQRSIELNDRYELDGAAPMVPDGNQDGAIYVVYFSMFQLYVCLHCLVRQGSEWLCGLYVEHLRGTPPSQTERVVCVFCFFEIW